jgi:DNA-directed RNA polymerase subunit L
MDSIIDSLDIETTEDAKAIAEFKTRLEENINYQQHINKYEFTADWFDVLDNMLVKLGYQANDNAIGHIINQVKRLILNTSVHDIKRYTAIPFRYTDVVYALGDLYGSAHIDVVNYFIRHSNRIRWDLFSQNHNQVAVDFLLQHPESINWDWFSGNENDSAVKYAIQHSEKINWNMFSLNKNNTAVEYLIQHPTLIDWDNFSSNENIRAVEYAIQHPKLINYRMMATNINSMAVEYMIQHPKKICLYWFAENTNDVAVEYLIQHPELIAWDHFSSNENTLAIEYLIQHPELIKWCFSSNENTLAVEYLIQHPELIDWMSFRHNTNIAAIQYCSDIHKNTKYVPLNKDKWNVDMDHIYANRKSDCEHLLELKKLDDKKLKSIETLGWLSRSGVKLDNLL